MKKIALVTPYFYPVIGGTQTVVINLAKQLKKKGYYVEILTPKVKPNSKKFDVYDGIKVVRHSRIPNKALNEIWFQLEILPYLRKFDIVQVFHPYFSLAGYLSKIIMGKKFLINMIGWDNYNQSKSTYIDKIVKFFSERCDLLFTSSDDLIMRAKKQYIRKKPIKIPHGISIPENKKASIDIRKKYGVEKKLLYIYVGRLAQIKNPMILLRAWKEIKDKDVFFLIIGDGELRNKMEQYIKANNLTNIKLTGFISNKELESAFRSADVLVHYSSYESFGLSMLEGMSYKLPVIATDTGAIPEIVTSDVGILIPLNNEKKLAEAIIAMKKNHASYAKAGFEKAKKYQWKNIAIEYIKYY
jgi:L-malate glycosyltransferase